MSRCTLMWECECACGCVKFCCISTFLECLQIQKGEKSAAASHTIKTNRTGMSHMLSFRGKCYFAFLETY